jgi:hypothetical protein
MSEFHAGRIAYFGPDGPTGREWFESVSHAGGRTLRAFCEMDDAGLTRDVTYALDPRSRPLDAHVRVTQGGRVTGTTLFVVEPDAVRCLGRTVDHGDVAQRFPLDEPLEYLGLHPLVGDALIATCRGTDRPGEFVPVRGVTNSYSPNGELGLLAMPIAIDVAYVGRESIAVAAGPFDADRYALRWQPQWPAADLWVLPPLGIFLRLTWSLIGARYELVELRTARAAS